MKRYVAAMIRDAKTEEGLTEDNFKVGRQGAIKDYYNQQQINNKSLFSRHVLTRFFKILI